MAPKKKQTKETSTASKRSQLKPQTRTKAKAGVTKKPTAPTRRQPARKARGAQSGAPAAAESVQDEDEDAPGDADADGEDADEEAGPPRKPTRSTRPRKRKAIDDDEGDGEDVDDAAGMSKGPPPTKRRQTGKGKGRAIDPPRREDDEREEEEEEDGADVGADTLGAAGPATVDDNVLVEEEERRWNGLDALATSTGRHNCTYKDNDARLIVSLKIHRDTISTSRLGYYARFLLQHGDAYEANDENASDIIGSIQSWRIAKAAGRFPNAEHVVWVDEILSARKKDALISETAKCLQVLFNRESNLKKVARDHADELTQRSLMFIEMIHIRQAYAKNGLLGPALEAWYDALNRLPEWFAFSGTLLLVPARPEGAKGDSWGAMDDLDIENSLTEVYRKYAFEVWVMGKLKDDSIPVMGCLTPSALVVDQDGGGEGREN